MAVFGEAAYDFLNLSTHGIRVVAVPVLFTPCRGHTGTLVLGRVCTIGLNFLGLGIDLSVFSVP